MKLAIVSGRSGSGKSVALRVLEDLGYYCVDNLPLSMISSLMEHLSDRNELVAISIDARNIPGKELLLKEQLQNLSDDIEVTSFFLNSDNAVLLRRYSETRRLHPLSKTKASLQDAIIYEGELLESVSQQVDHYIDTSTMSLYNLSDKIREILLGHAKKELVITFESFGFKHGLPQDADFVLDARFLPNPHWDINLREFTGLDKPIQDFFSDQLIVNQFISQVESMLSGWLPHLERNNRSYLTIAIGCTGGKHRSVYIAEQLAQRFKSDKHEVQAKHLQLTNT